MIGWIGLGLGALTLGLSALSGRAAKGGAGAPKKQMDAQVRLAQFEMHMVRIAQLEDAWGSNPVAKEELIKNLHAAAPLAQSYGLTHTAAALRSAAADIIAGREPSSDVQNNLTLEKWPGTDVSVLDHVKQRAQEEIDKRRQQQI